MTWEVPLFRIYWDQEDVDRVTDVVRSGSYWASGPQIAEFEEGIRRYLGTGHALTFSSGTSALHAVLLAAGIGAGDEVIVPSFTFIATANAPLFVGARPVFADIEETTFGMDPDDLSQRITPRTRAVIPVHYAGCPCRIREICEIASDHGLPVIEDAAEAFGAGIGGKRVGTFGDAGILSFCQNKILSTGEGGAVVMENEDWFRRLQLIRSHGRNEEGENYFATSAPQDYVALGYNFRISSLTAALGIAQLSKVDHLIDLRRSAAAVYRRELEGRVPRCRVPSIPRGHEPVYQIFSVRVPDRDGLMRHLVTRKILSKIYFPPVHLTHYYRRVLGYDLSLPVTERVSGEILSLPFYPGIPESQVNTVVTEMEEFYGR